MHDSSQAGIVIGSHGRQDEVNVLLRNGPRGLKLTKGMGTEDIADIDADPELDEIRRDGASHEGYANGQQHFPLMGHLRNRDVKVSSARQAGYVPPAQQKTGDGGEQNKKNESGFPPLPNDGNADDGIEDRAIDEARARSPMRRMP